MTVTTLGDLFRNMQGASRNAAIRTEMTALSSALTTGRKPDLAQATKGDFVPLAGLERDLAARSAFAQTATETASFLQAAQSALGRISDLTSTLGPNLISAASLDTLNLPNALGAEAVAAFETTVSSLNGRFADRSLFSGVATDTPALRPAEDILAALRLEVSGASTAADVVASVEAWFAPGGAYETVALTGSETPLAPLKVGADTEVDYAITASSAEIREVLTGLALGALVQDGPLGGNALERSKLAQLAGERMISAQSGFSELRAGLGSSEATVERASVRTAAEASALSLARSALVSADPFQTAARLSEVQAQLEALYAVTVRTSRLSLTEYLR